MVDISHLHLRDGEQFWESHEFEIDLNTTVTANRSFALEGRSMSGETKYSDLGYTAMRNGFGGS